MTIGIYALYWAEQGLVYIGQGVIESRYIQHIKSAQSKTHCNHKVQKAFDLYGVPEQVVLETNCIDINQAEMYWIKEFNATTQGLNILEGGGSMRGLNHPRSKYSKKTILKVFVLLLRNKLTYAEIANRTNVSLSNIACISVGRIHGWLKETYPKEFNEMVKLRKIRAIGSTPKQLTLIKDPEGIIHQVRNTAAFCREHPLLKNNWKNESSEINKIIRYERSQHKGFVVVEKPFI